MKKVLIAPTALKGTYSPLEVASFIARGVQAADSSISITTIPLADGGDGTLQSVHSAGGGRIHLEEIENALGEAHSAPWLELEEALLVELASACGLATIANLDAMSANTFGLGQLMKAASTALPQRELLVALGGSASTDGGAGALHALGAKFFDSNGRPLKRLSGGNLRTIRSVDLSTMIVPQRIRLLTDVVNPLLGESGAATIFAPQKGASSADIEVLEEGLSNFADVLERYTGRNERDAAGSGAAGGCAFGLRCALGAELEPGFKWLAAMTSLETKISASDIVISAEGHFDSQSLQGKVIGRLAQACQKLDRPLIVLAARVAANHESFANVRALEIEASTGELVTALDIERAAAELFKSTEVLDKQSFK